MSGYVEAGYLIVLGSLATYAASLVTRERAARRRRPPKAPEGSVTASPPAGGLASGERP